MNERLASDAVAWRMDIDGNIPGYPSEAAENILPAACRAIPELQPARPPPLVPLFPAGLPEVGAPLAEDGLFETDEVAVILVVRIGKAPRELPPNNTGLVDVRADDGEG